MMQLDTRMGTANSPQFSNGNCLPLTGVPFGMNYFAPQTAGEKGSWWFHPEDRVFQGFRLTHQPSPWMGDFSYLTFQGVCGKFSEVSTFQTQGSYRPEESIFSPDYLKIKSQRYETTTELVASCYGAALKIHYGKKDPGFFISLPGRFEVTQTKPNQLSGWLINFAGCEDPDFKIYFTFEFSEEFILQGKTSGDKGSLLLKFPETKEVDVRLGTSFLSLEQADFHLATAKKDDFTTFRKNSQALWASYLDKIQLTHHETKPVQTFYQCFYRALLFPQRFYETAPDGSNYHYDTSAKMVKLGKLYTNNGFWDTYKSVYPLYSLLFPELYGEMLEGFLTSYEETGFLPKWLSPDERGLMPGTLIDAVIADAVEKNIRPDLWEKLYEAMKKAATVQSEKENYGRRGTYDYLEYGYVPNTHHESVNHTLDYAYSDFCISQVAKKLGETKDAAFYQKQSLNYRNLFDKQTGFIRSKDKKGNFKEEFSPTYWGGDYAEGSAWQSSFAVYHDFKGLIALHGSKENFLNKLVTLCNQKPTFESGNYGFEIHEMSEMAAIEFGQLAISNQPSFHYPYLFSYAGKPEYAQPLLKSLLTETFAPDFTGFPGDEDNGSMAAWYMFSSLGFYPVTPGSGEYVIGMPLFNEAKLHLGNGKVLTITASPNYPQQLFIKEVSRNGKPYSPMYLTHEDLLTGGDLHFELGIVPQPKTYLDTDYPFSL